MKKKRYFRALLNRLKNKFDSIQGFLTLRKILQCVY